jgi:hypothetical protein
MVGMMDEKMADLKVVKLAAMKAGLMAEKMVDWKDEMMVALMVVK